MSFGSAGSLDQSRVHLQVRAALGRTRVYDPHASRDTAVTARHEADVRRRVYGVHVRSARAAHPPRSGHRHADSLRRRRPGSDPGADHNLNATLRLKGS